MDYIALLDAGNGVDDKETKPSKQYDNLPDFHLRNPLHNMKYLYRDPRNVSARIRQSLMSLRKVRANLVEGTPHDLITCVGKLIPEQPIRKLSSALGDVITRIRLDGQALASIDSSEMEDVITEASERLDPRLWSVMRFWGDVLLVMNALSSRRPVPAGVEKKDDMCAKKRLIGTVCYITGAMIGFPGGASELVVYDADWVRMASDVTTQRFLLNVSSEIGQRLNRVVYPPWSQIERLINWGDQLLSNYGNDGFKIIKAFEAVCIGVLLSRGREDSIIDRWKFLENTINDLRMDNTAYGDEADLLRSIIHDCETSHHITQLYGLHRLWGHPIVDSRKGMIRVKMIGRKDIIKDAEVGEIAARHFKINFCKNYRAKYRKYPNVIIIEGNKLCEMLLSNDPLATNTGVVSEVDWDVIEFEKTFNIPETFNLSMVVSDKAISLTKSELIKNVKMRKSVMNPEKRRGVLRWINDQTIVPKPFLQDINDGVFPDDHRIIGLTPKERELNPTPRMFALMSHQLRVYVVVTEQMISDHILPMFPQITMTDSLLDLTKKTYNVAKRQSPKLSESSGKKLWSSRTVCMSLDFEKWNGHMRKETTSPIFEALGGLFGMKNLYNMTYDIFESSYIYLADGSYIPTTKCGELIEEGELSFSGHKGGMEGLRQKGWTVFTVCCLDMVCSKYNCTYKIMGMGDNQVLQITVYTYHVDVVGIATEKGNKEMRDIISTLFSDLVQTFGKLGLPLKPLETWMSEDLHLYGKYPVWNGVPLCMDMKKIMRMFAYSNDDIMTLENAMGTIYGNAASATQGTCFSLLPYIMGILMSSLCIMDFLEYHPFLGEGLNKHYDSNMCWRQSGKDIRTKQIKIGEHGLNNCLLRLLIQIVPRSLGGYNSLNLYELMMRGFPDNLSRDMAYLYKIVPESPPDLCECLMNWMKPIYMPTRNYQLLIEDVSSVNLLTPRTPIAGIRQTVEEFIANPKRIKNREFRELMSGKVRDQARMLADRLCSGEKLHIRLLHDIYESTIIGYVDSILSKVTKASTIQRLAVDESDKDSMAVVSDDEVNCFRFFVWRSKISSDFDLPLCPTSLVKEMRRTGWGKEIKGVTTPFPLSYLTRTACGEDKVCSCDDGYISVHFPDRQESELTWNTTIGRNPPYLGSMTKEKVITGMIGKAYSTEPLINRPIRLMRVINWYVPSSSNTANIIRETVRAVTDSNPDLYEGKVEGTAGAEVHRYRDTSLKHGALTTSNYLYPTRYHVSTDNFTRYSKGGKNYDIHFQGCLCSIVEDSNIAIASWNRNFKPIAKFQHYKQTCYECVNELDEDFDDVPDVTTASFIPSRKNNSYLYVSEDSIQDTLSYHPLQALNLPFISANHYNLMTGEEKYNWLVDAIGDFVVSDIQSSGSSESFFSIGLTEVKAYERTMFLKIKPEDLFKSVVSKLRVVASWRCSSSQRGSKASHRDIIRYLESFLIDASIEAFSGLSMFFGWEETYKQMNFSHRVVFPNSVPASLGSSGQAVKKTLINLIRDEGFMRERPNFIITEDGKNSQFIHKMMLSDYILTVNNCAECELTLLLYPQQTLVRDLYKITCSKGHLLFMSPVRLYQSHVTIERLRKDADRGTTVAKPSPSIRLIPFLRETSCVTLINFDRLKQRKILWCQEFNQVGLDQPRLGTIRFAANKTSLRKIFSLPTAASYKYVELFSQFAQKVSGKTTFLVGDGLGSTSDVLFRMTGNSVIVSTLLETDDAMPQSYPHLVQPVDAQYGSTSSIDRKSMINKINDILSEGWEDDWIDTIISCELLVSDVEIIQEDREECRNKLLDKLLSCRDWKVAMIKDYIYSIQELCSRLKVILCKVSCNLKLISLGTKTQSVPEMWWIIEGVEKSNKVPLTYDPRSLGQPWRDLVYSMTLLDEHGTPKGIMDNINSRLSVYQTVDSMMDQLRSWAILPHIGSALPMDGSFTNFFYRLTTGKRPSFVRVEREDKRLRMYTKDHYRLREVIFGLAVAMVADIDIRVKMLNESESWLLDWETGSQHGSWFPYIYKSSEDISKAIPVSDVIPTLSILMSREGLSFKDVNTSVRFRSSRKRDILFFPISGTADLRKDKRKNRKNKNRQI